MKKGKGDSGKAYHVRKEAKRKKKQDKELDKWLEEIFGGLRKNESSTGK